MVTDIGRFVLEVIQFVWPFVKIDEWERGVYYVLGRYVGVVPRRIWLVPALPWVCDVRCVTVVPDVFETEEQTIETRDGGTLTFTATVKLRVTDPAAALNEVANHIETAVEDCSAVLAETLAELDAERLDPERRRGLLRRCVIDVNRELGQYGVEAEYIRFTNFIRNIRCYRLFFGASGTATTGDDE